MRKRKQVDRVGTDTAVAGVVALDAEGGVQTEDEPRQTGPTKHHPEGGEEEETRGRNRMGL